MAITEKYVSDAGAGAHDGSSPSNAFSWTEMKTDINAGGKAGNRYNVIGTINPGSTNTSLTGNGTATSPIIIRGYASTIGDGYLGRTNSNGPLIATNFPTIAMATGFSMTLGNWTILENVAITGSLGGNLLSTGSDCTISRCTVVNSSTGSGTVCVSLATRSCLIDSDLSRTGASGTGRTVNNTTTAGRVIGCRIVGGPSVGVLLGSTCVLAENQIYGGTIGVSQTDTSASSTIYGNTIVDNSSDGINIVTSTSTLQQIFNNLITDNGGYGINGVSSANAILSVYNRLDRNTSGAINLATDWVAATSWGNNVSSVLKADEYVDASTRDYRLKSTSPAKAAGLFAYRDIGAIQRQEEGGGAFPVIGLASPVIRGKA